ncbi:MAG: SDR family NAD(P)-dependent oxidoreductase [Dehalococcoidia bacterium]|nr:SDR family NAD(P)-dependent oxidoreductase [Dehalococcoidia bacterium]MDD5494804.1 SDR family NAD(P)-dependent oxidoreductase [Dehalococcoidia bacterium]
MEGQVCMVTGASSGIGKEIALGLARLGATIVLVCRDAGRGQAALAEIQRSSGNNSLDLLLADLSSQKQIRKLAKDFRQKYRALHVLVNNAGIVTQTRCLSEDGIEIMFAVNYLAYFLLSNLLLDVLKASAPSRIVNITSSIHKSVRLDFSNLQGEKRFNKNLIYAQNKLADVIFTYELARRLENTGVTVTCACPGATATRIWEPSSRFMDTLFKTFMKEPAEGARIPLYLATSPELEGVTCRYYQTRQHLKRSRVNPANAAARSSRETYDKDIAKRLWQLSEELTGLSNTTI